MTELRLLHGFAGLPAAFDRVREPLGVSAACAVLLPGHGPDAALVADDWQGAVDALAARLPPSGCILVGYSLGARLTLAMAMARPDLVRAALLIGGTAGIDDPRQREARRRWDDDEAEAIEQDLAAWVRHWEKLPIFSSQSPSQIAQQRDMRLAHRPAPLAWAMRALGQGRMPSLWPSLAELETPLTLMCGERDDKYCAIAQRIQRLAPSTRLELVEGCGHNLLIEAPEAVARQLAQMI